MSGFCGCPQMTAYQLQRQREMEAKRAEEAAKEKSLQTKREVTEDSYSALVEVENINKLAGDVEARNVDQALAGLSVVDGAPADLDKHPERWVGMGDWLGILGTTQVGTLRGDAVLSARGVFMEWRRVGKGLGE